MEIMITNIRRMLKRVLIPSLLILVLFGMSACQTNAETSNDRLVYASIYPIGLMVEDLLPEGVELRTFVPANEDPHFWEPTAKDMKELGRAQVLFINGANMERWADSLGESLPDLRIVNLSENVELISYKGAAALGDFQYMARIDLEKGETIRINYGHTHEDLMRFVMFKDGGENDSKLIDKAKSIMEEKGKVIKQQSQFKLEDSQVYAVEMGHTYGFVDVEIEESGSWIFVSDRLSEEILSYDILDGNGELKVIEPILEGSSSSLDKVTYDPHSWLSIENAKTYYRVIGETLAELFPESKKSIEKKSYDVMSELGFMSYEYMDEFKNRRVDEFITVHNAYGYIARDFNLTQFPLNNLVSTESPSMKTIRTALTFSYNNDVDTIFYEPGSGDKAAQALAEEIPNGKAVPIVSMEYGDNLDAIKGKAYIEIMRYNLDAILEAVK